MADKKKRARVISIAIGVCSVLALSAIAVPAQAAQQTLAAQTFATTWAWTGVDFGGSTATGDQRVTADVSGITSDNRNAGVVLREGGGHFLRAQVKQSAVTWKTIRGC